MPAREAPSPALPRLRGRGSPPLQTADGPDTVTKLDNERLQLKARSQQISRDVDALRNRGRNVAGRVRSGLRTQYGCDSERLTEFGVNPRRRRVRARLAEEKALAKLSDPDPVS